MNLRAQHHTVLSLEHTLSISAVGYLHPSGCVLADSCVKGCTVCAHTFVRIMFYAPGSQPTIVPACVSMLRIHKIVVLDTAWPWASEAYGLCRLRAYFCAHKLIRARSNVVIPQVGIAMGFLLQIRMGWLRALSKGCRCWCWCCGPWVLVL